MENYNQFKALISSMDKDAVKFFTKGNASAGTRLRKKTSACEDGCARFAQTGITDEEQRRA